MVHFTCFTWRQCKTKSNFIPAHVVCEIFCFLSCLVLCCACNAINCYFFPRILDFYPINIAESTGKYVCGHLCAYIKPCLPINHLENLKNNNVLDSKALCRMYELFGLHTSFKFCNGTLSYDHSMTKPSKADRDGQVTCKKKLLVEMYGHFYLHLNIILFKQEVFVIL